MRRCATSAIILIVLIALWAPSLKARAGGSFTFIYPDLLTNWEGAVVNGWTDCAGVWASWVNNTELGYTGGTGNCASGEEGIFIKVRPINPIAAIGTQIYETSYILHICYDTGLTFLYPCFSEQTMVGRLLPTDQIVVGYTGQVACGIIRPCSMITGVIINYDYILQGSTPAPTNTPALPSPTGTIADYSTVPPASTDLPSGTPEPHNTIVAGPLPTIGNIDTCVGDPFSPCGTMPWAVVDLPTLDLASPTAFPVYNTPTPHAATFTPSVTLTPTGTIPTATITPSPTFTPTGYTTPVNFGGGDLSTLASFDSSTLMPLANLQVNLNGTPTGLELAAANIGGQAGRAISLINAIQNGPLNSYGGLITAVLLMFIFVLIVEVITLILPVILAIVRFILQAIAALKPF